MSRSRSRPAGKKGASAGPSARKAVANAKKPLWRRAPAVWLGGFATIVLGGALANLLSNQAQQQISPSPSGSQVAAPSATSRPIPSGHPLATVKPTSTREAKPPLTIISEDPINPQDNGGTWAFPGKFILTSSQLKALNGLENIHEKDNWFFTHGGSEPATDTQLVVQNNRSYPVRVIDVNVIKHCGAPLSGTLFYSPNQGADSDIRLGFNLDSTDPEAEYATGWEVNSWKPDYFSNYTVPINPGTQQVFNLRAVVKKFACSFEYQFTVLDGTRKVSQIINDGGQLFRATGIRGKFTGTGMRFSKYQIVYAGGAENVKGNGAYVRVNPETFLG